MTSSVGKLLHGGAAAGGFFSGYLWAVLRWAERGGQEVSLLVRSALPGGVCLALLYAFLLLGLFWPWLPAARRPGLHAVVSPAAFTLSALAGAAGLEGALRVLGG